MINIILKTLSVLGLAFFTFFVFVLGQIPLIEGKHLLNPYIDTEFAANFSPEKLEQIKIGMDVATVISLLGEPLSKSKGYIDTTSTNYHYSNDGKLLHATKNNGQNGYEDFAWYSSSIVISKDGKVASIDKGWSFD